LFAAAFASLNKRNIGESDALSVTGIEMAAGMLLITLIAPWFAVTPAFVFPDLRDLTLLILLAVGCTLLPFALSLVALRHISAFAAALAINMEPIYSIVLAIVLLNEQRELDASFYLGVTIIVGVVFLHPWIRAAKRGTESEGR
jgi:drug/metabolite transporter (DMT)-like permease